MTTGILYYLLLAALFVLAEPVYSAGEVAKQYRLCMLYEDASGQLKAGLVSKVNNRNFFLQIGESQDGLRLTDVRLEQGVALIELGGELAELTMEGVNFPQRNAAFSGGTSAVLAAASIYTRPQFFKRKDAPDVPEHIQAALLTPVPEPQQPRMTLKPRRAGNEAGRAAQKTGGTMVVQSVPKCMAENLSGKRL